MEASNELHKLNIDGIEEVINALEGLELEIASKLLKNINRKIANKYVTNELKSTLPYSSSIKKNIRTLSDSSDPRGVLAGPTSDAYWIRFIDKGTVKRKTKKGANRGQIIGKNKVEPTIDKAIDPIIEHYNNELGNELEKMITRRLKNLAKNKK